MLFVKDKSECAVNALWSGVLMSQYVWHLDCCPLRHGVPGGSHGGSEPGPPGARRWPWSYHHLLLKKKKKYKTLAPHPAHVDCCHGYRSPGIFEGRSLIWFLWRGGGCWKAGPLVIDACLKDLRMKENSSGWLAESTSAVCVHAGPPYPCTWRIEHRDTLFCSFNSGKLVMFSHIFIFFPSLCWCCRVTGTHCVKISKGVHVRCWYEPRSVSRCLAGAEAFSGPEKTMQRSYRKALNCRKVMTYWIFNIKHSLVMCTFCITICAQCYHFKELLRNK